MRVYNSIGIQTFGYKIKYLKKYWDILINLVDNNLTPKFKWIIKKFSGHLTIFSLNRTYFNEICGKIIVLF